MILLLLAPALTLAAAQHIDRSTDRLPPAIPLAPGEDAPAVVLAPLQAVVAARVPADVLAQVRPEGGVTLVSEAADGGVSVRLLGWRDYAARAEPGAQERLTDPAVEIDGATAMVWSPYIVTIANRIDHCGVEHAALVREGGRWRIATLTHSERTTECGG